MTNVSTLERSNVPTTLSVIIPVYNERTTLPAVLTRVAQALPEVSKEIIVVDDGSTDGTREWLQETFGETNPHPAYVALDSEGQLVVEKVHQKVHKGIREKVQKGKRHRTRERRNTFSHFPLSPFSPACSVKVLFHDRNRGKGAALRTGFQAATGDVLVIQDADLEYDPRDWEKMWRLIAEGWADVVYGSRFYGEPHRALYFHHFLGNKVISNLINLLCDITLSDIEVCYKMFRREVLEGLHLTCDDFGFEVEFTMKVARARRWRIYEVAISYYGRTYAEGKKINWKDGLKALWYIAKYRSR